MATQSVRIGWRPYVNVVTQVVNAVDADATAFITAAGITNLTQAAAINTLVNDLKTYGLWTKMKALYPMVGGTATSHKFNLKDPRDLDAAYRLVFNGGWIHSLTGATPNGTTGYANPNYINVTDNSSIWYYSRTNNTANSVEMGTYNNPWSDTQIDCNYGGTSGGYIRAASNGYTGLGWTSTTSQGFYGANRTSSILANSWYNGVKKGTNTNTSSQDAFTKTLFIGAYNSNTGAMYFSNRESAFASIGDGLTDGEAANFYTSVQKFQTTLGRQIGSPIVSDTDAQAFLNAAGITDLGQATAVNTLVVDLKAAGVWTKMKAVYPFVGGTATTHKFNLKDPRDLDAAYRLVFNGGWTHTGAGAQSNGTTGYANTNINANQIFTSNNGLMGIYTPSTSLINSGYLYGVSNMADSEWSMTYGSGTLNFGVYRANPVSSTTTLPGLSAIGFETNGYRSIYKNNSRLASTAAGFIEMPQNLKMYLSARNANGNADAFTGALYSFSFISSTLTLTEYSAFYTAVQKYQTTLGRQVGTPVLESGQTANLLDTYSSATVAYSLRKLRNGYYGFAIRVRRSSDNAEQDIAFKTDGTLDTTSLLAFVGSGNGFVTTWYDQSGNGYNAYQSTAINQPLIVSSGSLTTNGGKPAIRCAGSTGLLINQISLGTTHSMFAVIDWSGPNKEYFGSFGNSWAFYQVDGEYKASGAVGRTNAAFTTNRFLGTLLRVNTQLQYYQNSATLGSAFTINANNVFNLSNLIGEDYNWGFAGDQQEAIIYTSSMASSRTAIESNINSYYSIY